MKRLLSIVPSAVFVLVLSSSVLRGQCEPTEGTYRMWIEFPGFPAGEVNLPTCPTGQSIVGIRVMGEAVSVSDSDVQLPIGAFGFNVDLGIPGTVHTVNPHAGFNVGDGPDFFIEGTSVAAIGVAPADSPVTGPVVLATIVFEPSPASTSQVISVDFAGDVALPNGFAVENTLVDAATTCDVLTTTDPALELTGETPTVVRCPSDFVRGDCNNNGRVAGVVGDPLTILIYLFVDGSIPIGCLNACDSDDNNLIEISDAIYLLDWMFQGNTAPPAPTPMAGPFLEDCGADPTPSTLGCDSPVCP